MPFKTKKELPVLVVETAGQESCTYVPKAALSNRGQPGVAGFYQEQGRPQAPQLLMKQDKPGTCLAESLMVTYLPAGEVSKGGVIGAHVGIGHAEDAPNKKMVLSIQNKLVPRQEGEFFVKFDELVLGHERNPKASSSEESQNSERIKQFLSTELSKEVKLQLAQAIYLSQLNGDESLHLGQFVCLARKGTDAQGQEKMYLTDIKRIDFGALGRYAMIRSEHTPEHTSFQYRLTTVGQKGKDYVSYLLQDPEIKNEVMRLWSKTDPNEVVRQVGARFDEQVAQLHDPELKKTALSEFNKELGAPVTQKPEVGTVKTNLLDSTARRCVAMRKAAEAYNDLQAIEAFEKYVKHQLASNAKDSFMQGMEKRLEKIKLLPPNERLKKVLEAQADLVKQVEGPTRDSSKTAASSEALARKATAFKKDYTGSLTPSDAESQEANQEGASRLKSPT